MQFYNVIHEYPHFTDERTEMQRNLEQLSTPDRCLIDAELYSNSRPRLVTDWELSS